MALRHCDPGSFRFLSVFILLTACLLLCPKSFISPQSNLYAQVYQNIYRPATPEWYKLQTPYFKILFQDGEQEAAYRTAHILEEQYPAVQSLVGGRLRNMPVVLNGQNDLSNGYVTTLNFRIEVEIPRIKGKSMNPLDGSWLNTVMPHELVHALHLNVMPRWGTTWFIRPFSPDLARSMHFAAPVGMLEGIAVFHETHHHYDIGGRGNHAYFTNQHLAVAQSGTRWSLAQMLTNPMHEHPFDRHYIGGYEFIHWLQYEYGMDITKKTIQFVSRWPFLGYGSALWYHTGKRPSQLYQDFVTGKNIRKNIHNNELDHFNVAFTHSRQWSIGRSRRPVWISDDEILMYSQSGNIRPGYYYLNLNQMDFRLFHETGNVEDYLLSLHPDRSRFMYARYHRHPIYDHHFTMGVYEVQVSDGAQVRLISESNDRVHAPEYGPNNSRWALQTFHENNILVRLQSSGIDTLLVPYSGYIVQFAFKPSKKKEVCFSDTMAVIANRDGLQALWFLSVDSLEVFNQRNPDISFDGASVMDLSWHPDGEKLLFTSDYGGAMNLFVYDVINDAIHQLTNHRYGIMEGSFSPDGSRIAAIQISENRFEPVILEEKKLHFKLLESDIWKRDAFSGPSPSAPFLYEKNPSDWQLSRYKTGYSWLRPRSLFPYWTNESSATGNRFGVTLSSGDVLRRNSYTADFSTSNRRFWFDAAYHHTGFYPGFGVNIFHQPLHTTLGLWEKRGARLQIPFRYMIDQDTRISRFFIIPSLDLQQQKSVEPIAMYSDWTNRVTGSIFLAFHYDLHQKFRDAQPSAGWLFFVEFEQDVYSELTARRVRAMRSGLYRYLSFRKFSNRSMRAGIEFLTQNQPFFDISGFYSIAFDEKLLSESSQAARYNTRYTIPIIYPDRGSILLPFHVDRIYLVFFSDTIVPFSELNEKGIVSASRTLYGTGIRAGMRFFQVPFDIGVAFVIEPSRNRTGSILGSF